jgi:hypothetical protein
MIKVNTGMDSMNADLRRPFKKGTTSAPMIKINGGAPPDGSIS